MTGSEETIRQWEAMAPDAIAALDPDGDFPKRHLLNPVVLDLLGDVHARTVLDAGCGQGYFSRMLADRGAVVTGVEPAGPLFRHCVEMEQRQPRGITMLQADLTAVRLEESYDAVVANMVFCTIPDWTAALRTCVQALRPGGRLVFSVPHPCFETGVVDRDALRVDDYLTERPLPLPVATDVHRTLGGYLNGVVAAGCRLEAVREPALPAEALDEPDAPPDAGLWTRLPNFLVVVAIREV